MSKNIFTIGLLAIVSMLMMSAASTHIPFDEHSTTPTTLKGEKKFDTNAPFELVKLVRDDLAAKSQHTALSKKEARMLKKLDKKVEKWDMQYKRRAAKGKPGRDKSWIAALLLCFFLGYLGIHRFYLGYTWQGVVQLLTLGGFGIWALIDFIRILVRDLYPKYGDYVD